MSFQMLLLLFLTMVLATDDFLIVGLDTNLNYIFDTLRSCNYPDYSCNNIMCDILGNTTRYIPYVCIIPGSDDPNCSQIPLSKPVTMTVFGVDEYGDTTEPIVCQTTSDCLTKGCQMYSYTDYTWPIYNGSC